MEKRNRIAGLTTAQENGLDVREYLARLFGTGELALPLKNE